MMFMILQLRKGTSAGIMFFKNYIDNYDDQN